ncbi:TolC family protein [Candidatus Dependentiae bacterium]|nr:TolC family protein [Candidatus Dependentiae bacterium]
MALFIKKSLFSKRIMMFLLFFLINSISVYSENITLNQCFEKLKENYPILKNKDYFKNISSIKIENYDKEWMPSLYLRGNISDQSDAVPRTDRDKYQINFEIEQIIYEGGIINNQKNYEKESEISELKKIEIEIYKLKEKVCKIYFDIILAGEQIKIFENTLKDLKSRLNSVESAVKNGVRLKNDLSLIKSEILTIEQDILSKQNRKRALFEILNELTGLKLNEYFDLIYPEIFVSDFENESGGNRLELSLYDSEKKKTDIMNGIIATKSKPKINAFLQMGYGKPGLNMFENIFEKYAVAGIKFNWKVYDWKTAELEKNINNNRKQIIETEKEIFRKNIKISLIELFYEIKTLEKTIIKDSQNIEIRKEILESILSQYNNGIATATEYIINSNNLLNAKNILKIHEVQLKYYLANYKIIRGDEL